MHSSVISRSVFIVIALLVLASCDHRGSKVEAGKAKEVKSGTNSTPAKAKNDITSQVGNEGRGNPQQQGRFSPTRTTTKNTVYDNGITQFNAR